MYLQGTHYVLLRPWMNMADDLCPCHERSARGGREEKRSPSEAIQLSTTHSGHLEAGLRIDQVGYCWAHGLGNLLQQERARLRGAQVRIRHPRQADEDLQLHSQTGWSGHAHDMQSSCQPAGEVACAVSLANTNRCQAWGLSPDIGFPRVEANSKS